jgi:aminopeptidase N
MWIHEGFTAYVESLFLEYYYGKKAGDDYVVGKGQNIKNDRPIIGSYNVNKEGSSDMYNKGAYMLHTLRQLIENDEKWRRILRGLNSTFYHQTVTTKQIEDYLSKETGIDLTAFFNQYLRDVRIPTLEYEIKNNKLHYRYTQIVDHFDMSILIEIDEDVKWLYPKANWQITSIKSDEIKVDPNFLVYSKKL